MVTSSVTEEVLLAHRGAAVMPDEANQSDVRLQVGAVSPVAADADPADMTLNVEDVSLGAGEAVLAKDQVLASARSKASLVSATDTKPRDLHASYVSHSKQLQAATPLFVSFFLMMLASTGGALLAFCFQHGQGLSSTMASALTGVIANSLDSPFREVMFAGSFAGMSGNVESGGPFAYEHACLVGVLVGVVFKALSTRFNGAGGKLGTIAFLSGVLVTVPVQLADTDKMLVGWKTSAPWKSFDAGLFVGAVISSGCGCAVTVALMNKPRPLSSTVLASSVTGIGACALFCAIPSGLLPDVLSPVSANILSMFAYTGSFAGMSAVTRVGSLPRIVLSGFVSGAILLALWPLFPGIGGKFGFSAMLSVLMVERLPTLPIKDTAEKAPSEKMQTNVSKVEVKTDGDSSVTLSKPKTPTGSAFLRRRMTLGNFHVAAARREEGNDWLAWVPARAWKAASTFIAQGCTRNAAAAALIESYGEHHADQLSALVDRDLDVRSFLQACRQAERIIQPPPKLICGVEADDATAMYALEVFEALRSSNACKENRVPSNVAKQLLRDLEVPDIGVQVSDNDVTPQIFSRAVEDRFGLRARNTNMEHMVRSGLYE